MPKHNSPSLVTRLYRLWLAALAALFLFAAWGYLALRPEPAASVQAATPAEPAAEKLEALALPPVTLPSFDPDRAAQLITAFPLQGMRHLDDAEPVLVLLPPGTEIAAQVIERDPSPTVLTEGVHVRYALDAPYDLGGEGPNAGQASGELRPEPDAPAFAAAPALPSTLADGTFVPYPTASVQAVDAKGAVLAETRMVLPQSSETGCRACHGGPWKTDGKAGVSRATAEDILAVHDRRNGTRLMNEAKQDRAVTCAACHGAKDGPLNLSAAVHGFHAAMRLEGAEACAACHPSAETGATRFYRDFHAMWGLDCTRCHGPLEDHAIALLRFEAGRGSKAAAARLAGLRPRLAAAAEDIAAREPRVNMPHCSGCHDFKEKPDAAIASAFNKWTKSGEERFSRALDNTGTLRCPSCHGAPHALYPASNPAGDERDNLQPLQYQNAAMPLGKDGNCGVCHTVDMPDFIHHDLVGQ